MTSLAVLGASVTVLLKLVVEAKERSSNFQPILTRLESTLIAIIPRCDEISRLNNELDISQHGMKELGVIISDGGTLVLKCSKISTLNLVKKMKYSKKLSDLETTLLRYFTTILPLDHFKDTKEILVVLKRLELKLLGDEDEGGLNRGESGKPKDDFGSGVLQEAPKLYNNDYEKELLKELVGVNDGKIYNGSESEKPKEDLRSRAPEGMKLYRNSKKKEAVKSNKDSKKGLQMELVGDNFEGICNSCELGKPKEDSTSRVQEAMKLCNSPKRKPAVKLYNDSKDESQLKIECDKLAENPKQDSTSGVKQATKLYRKSRKKGVMLHDDSDKEVNMKLLDDVDEGICNQNESGKTMRVSGSEMESDMKLVQGLKKELKWYQAFRKEDETTKLSPKYVQIKPSGTQLFLLKGCLHHNLDLQDLQWSEADSLGNGRCGTTYRCNTKYGEFRIKRLTEVNVGEKEFKQRVVELGKVGQHSNIMPPFGYYFSEFEKFLVYDYSPEGSLSALLHENKSSGRSSLDWNSRVKIALGSARGIAHLHSKGGGVKLLGSIKSSNILLTSDFNGCISDYGLTPIMNFFATSSQESEDHAPEIPLISSLKVCQKSDVYSFGLLLLEILTGQKPALVDLPRWINTKIWEEKQLNVLFDMELLDFQHFEAEMKQMLQIAMQCVEMNPDKRPKMDSVVRLVEKIRPSH